jgi:heme-degrading monooxygenase HmoA
MPKYENVDPNVSLLDQIQSDHSGPFVVIGTYTAPADQMENLIKGWIGVSDFMRRQPGFLSAQMHRAIGSANVLVNYAVWESLDAFRAAHDNPKFGELDAHMPADAVFRHLLVEKIAIPGLCVA